MPPSACKSALQGNFLVDYVVRYTFDGADRSQAMEQLERLLRALAGVGLQTEVRRGDESSLLVFVRASEKRLRRAVHRSRVRDWLYGVRHTEPDANSTEPQTEAERLRIINNMITLPREEGGAGITPKQGEWKHVDAIFPLHDEATNQKWMRDWSQKTFLTRDDLDQIRNKFGEQVGFYFAFLQSYFGFLIFPAVFGFSCWWLLGSFSVIYTVINCLWCIIFIEYWKRQEVDFALRWQTRGVSAIPSKRREFKPEKDVRDATTGEVRKVFPVGKRLVRQLLQIPFALLAASALGIIIATCFAIEIFISEVYSGPLKSYLVFIPTILLSSLVPTISAVLTSVATKLNDFENYESQDSYDVALTQKIFVLNFITSYLPVFLTAFIYVPFGSIIVPYLDVFQVTVCPFVAKDKVTVSLADFRIDPARLRKQVIYFTVTAQAVNFGLEVIVPLLKRKLFRKYKEFNKERAAKNGNNGQQVIPRRDSTFGFDDPTAEKDFLARVRNEAELDEYDVTTDLREMCIQFGYLSLFSPVWPLVPVSFLINNWIELRGDFFKICKECRRPTPQRTDTIGPWIDALGFLAWLGSITSSALLYMFSNDGLGPDGTPGQIKGWALMLTIFFAEHLYLIVRAAVQAAMSKIELPSMRQAKAESYMLRKRYLTSLLEAEQSEAAGKEEDEKEGEVQEEPDLEEISRASLEADDTVSSLRDATPAERFWARQRSWRESARVGAGIIQLQATTSPEIKKVQ